MQQYVVMALLFFAICRRVIKISKISVKKFKKQAKKLDLRSNI